MALRVLKNSRLAVVLPALMLFTLTGCGDEEPAESAAASGGPGAMSGGAGSVPSSDSAKPTAAKLDLSAATIDRADFLGLNPPKVVEPEPCPFLSDETALKTAKRTEKLLRRNTSNTECYWSRNLGFSIKVSVEPLASAKPLKERAYNLDSPPIFQPQSGPGSNAIVLLDTVWDKAGRPYAMGFEQDNQLITVYVMGLSTDTERLVATANEVAAKLPKAPTVVDHVMNPQRFDLCSVWSQENISAAMGSAATSVKTDDACTWNANDASIAFGLFYGGSFPFDSLIEQGGQEIENLGVRAVVSKQRAKGSQPAASVLDVTLGDDKMINLKVSDSVPNSGSVAIALAQNLVDRLK